MATSASGDPTPNGIPTIAPSVDAPDGVGVNSIITAVDTLFTSALKTVFKKAGAAVGTRRALNLIEGSNVAITVADDGANDKVDVTIAATVPSVSPSIANGLGLLADRPTASAAGAGFTYFATDQVAEYISDGTNWIRSSLPAGATLDFFNATAPAGWVKYDGTALPASTGIYAALYAHLGTTTTPDTRGRVTVGLGTHTDVDTVGKSDGLAVGSRTPKHNSSDNISFADSGHTHPPAGGGQFDVNNKNGGLTVGYSVGNNHSNDGTTGTGNANLVKSGSVGPGGSRPADQPANIVALKIAKL